MKSRARSLRGLRHSRQLAIRVILPLAILLELALAAVPELGALKPVLGLGFGSLALALAVPVLFHLHGLAARCGGGWYALGQTLLATCLTPVVYLGVLAVPLLVESDIRKGLARWRGETAQTLLERILWTLVHLGAFVLVRALAGPPLGVPAGFLACLIVHVVRKKRLLGRRRLQAYI